MLDFGGFATLSCITRLPDYNWKAAVDIVGPSNLITFVKTVPEHWKRFMGELVGDAEKEQDFLRMRSPVTFVDNATIIRSAHNTRCKRSQSCKE